ncbi:MAG: hypothetical protein IT331_01915 [Anaerolineae bacterium]|nr:hypothetical protein [Anaerolineae bacterium]
MTLTPDEQTVIARAAILAAATVAISKYSGKGGQNREFDAMLNEYTNVARQNPDSPLLQLLLLPIVPTEIAQLKRQFEQDPKQSVFNEFKMAALNRCAQAAALMDAQASPADAALFKKTVMDVCDRVAHATAEGSVMGLGGTSLDAKESAVIAQVRRALGA